MDRVEYTSKYIFDEVYLNSVLAQQHLHLGPEAGLLHGEEPVKEVVAELQGLLMAALAHILSYTDYFHSV